MSSALYGRVTTRRIEERVKRHAQDSDDDKKKWLDALAALVPAEALGLITGTKIAFTETKKAPTQDDPDATLTIVTSVLAARVVIAVAMLGAIALYALGRWMVTDSNPTPPAWSTWDLLRLAIPPTALWLWLMLGYTPIFNAAFFRVSDGSGFLIAAIGAFVLGIIAVGVRYKPAPA